MALYMVLKEYVIIERYESLNRIFFIIPYVLIQYLIKPNLLSTIIDRWNTSTLANQIIQPTSQYFGWIGITKSQFS